MLRQQLYLLQVHLESCKGYIHHQHVPFNCIKISWFYCWVKVEDDHPVHKLTPDKPLHKSNVFLHNNKVYKLFDTPQ